MNQPYAGNTRVFDSDLLAGTLAAVIGVLMYVQSGVTNAWLFPKVTALAMLAIGLALAYSGFVNSRRASGGSGEREEQDRRILVAFVIAVAAYVYVIPIIGFELASTLMFVGVLRLLHPAASGRSILVGAAVGALVVLVIASVFREVFYVPLPRGRWWTR